MTDRSISYPRITCLARLILLAIVQGSILAASPALAQTYTLQTIATFSGTDGSAPTNSLMLDSANNLYGTTEYGGTNGEGSVFEVAAGSGQVTSLVSFSGLDGEMPYGSVTRNSAGALFGTTYRGGANGVGTIFTIAAGSNTVTTQASFDSDNGIGPVNGYVRDSSGNIYGAALQGGSSGYGAIYRFDATTDTISNLASFTSDNGSNPEGIAVDSAGNIFGTTSGGGANGVGTVFEIVAGTNVISTLFSFDGTNGGNPDGGVTIDSAGNIFGTTEVGGTNNDGTIFKITAGTHAFSTVASFDQASGYGSASAVTLDASGNLFGTTTQGGGTSGSGTVFEVASGSNEMNALAVFDGDNGASPNGAVTLDSNGNIFGTTIEGGASNNGTVYELVRGSATAPEPAALALLASGGIAADLRVVLRRRRRI